MVGTASIDLKNAEATLRDQYFDKVVTGFAEAQYKFKPSLNVVSNNAWKDFFFQENPAALTAPGAESFQGIPRGANFPQAAEEWNRIQSTLLKHGAEDVIYWEDIISDTIDIQDRTLFRIAEAVTKSVDDAIWSGLGGNNLIGVNTITSGINNFAVGRNNTTGHWNSTASAAIIDDLLRAKQLVMESNYSVDALELWVSPRDYRSILTHLTNKGAQFPEFSTEIAKNGRAGTLAGIQIVVSNSVAASNAMVIAPKIAANWREAVPLKTTTIEDPYKTLTIRATEIGVVELRNAKCVVLIQGTQA